MAMLQRYAWPGNIRELQNVIERWAIICGTDDISVDESWLPRDSAVQESTRSVGALPELPPDDQLNLDEYVEALERQLITRAMTAVGGNQSEAARRLGVSRGKLLGRLRKYGPVSASPVASRGLDG